jgi:hypothetical protein
MRALLAYLASGAAFLAALGSPVPAWGQVELTLQGGVHFDGTEPVRQSLQQGTGGRTTSAGGRSSAGEATTAGARIGVALSDRWTLDGGVAWSRSTSRMAAVGQPTPPVGPRTLFASSTVQGRLSDPGSRLVLVGGAGPALIFERGDGTSPARRTNIGGLAMMAAILRLDTRASIRLDAQQYLFSGDIGDSYTPHLGTAPMRSPGARLRHDFVLLAGFSWRAD